MMLITELHYALLTTVIFIIGMRDHMSFQMRASFEGLIAPFLLTNIIPILSVLFIDMPIVMTDLFEGFIANSTKMLFLLLFSHFPKSRERLLLWL